MNEGDNPFASVSPGAMLSLRGCVGIMARIRKTGVIKIRGTLPCSDAQRLNKDMEQAYACWRDSV